MKHKWLLRPLVDAVDTRRFVDSDIATVLVHKPPKDKYVGSERDRRVVFMVTAL